MANVYPSGKIKTVVFLELNNNLHKYFLCKMDQTTLFSASLCIVIGFVHHLCRYLLELPFIDLFTQFWRTNFIGKCVFIVGFIWIVQSTHRRIETNRAFRLFGVFFSIVLLSTNVIEYYWKV